MAHILKLRIYYEDTDCGNVVYYANYLKYCERARTEFLESKGISMKQLIDDNIFFVVAEASLKYLSPGRYGDILAVETVVDRVGPASISFKHEIRRDATGERLVQVMVKLGCVNQAMKPLRLRQDIMLAVKEDGQG
ncbi:MAG: YbgC/FadM family acyl-CoA thioesterase [Nitrospirota bacterium]|nr:YbgC/FadM family acyl-CoA thioesterase [Nitrospirota bacterium]